MFGCKSLEIVIVVIIIVHEIENGTGKIILEVVLVKLTVEFVWLSEFKGILIHKPELGIVSGGHCARQ